MFLALAAVGGLVAGRLTRGLTADASPDQGSTSATGVEAGRMPISSRPVVTATTSDPLAVQPFQAEDLSGTPATRTESEPAWDVR